MSGSKHVQENSLQVLRARIDALDEEIQTLVNQRAACAQQVAHVKREQGTSDDYYRPEREAQILREVMRRNQGPLDSETMAGIFRQIISACLAAEAPLRVAYLGPPGTFTQAAALKHFGQAVQFLPLAAADEIFREVEAGAAAYGVVPIENSTEGMVTHTLDMFLKSPLKICGEIELRINHHLLSRADDIAQIKQVISHRQSLAQCREWLQQHLPQAEQVAVSSNAEAAKQVSALPDSGAIGADVAAGLYGLRILASNLEDEPNNTTRFLVIGKKYPSPSGCDKTSLLVSAKNKPGALYDLLSPLAQNERTMTRIESRPARSGLWEYVFFLDLEGHVEDIPMARAIRALEKEASLFKVLGSYPKAVL